MKKLFEKWVVSHFGSHIQAIINEGFDEEDGYADETINAMWVGFNGYAILADSK